MIFKLVRGMLKLNMHKITLILGTSRQGSYSSKVAEFIKAELEKTGQAEITFVDPRTMDLNLKDEANFSAMPELKKIMAETEGFIIVSPEYNHGYPATLKFLLDLNFPEYKFKPVALIGVSNGAFGGTRMIESLVGVTKALGMINLQKDMYISNVKEIFAENYPKSENLTDLQRRLQTLFASLFEMLEKIKK